MPEAEYKSNKALSFAAGRFERGLVNGLSAQNRVKVTAEIIEPQESKYPTGKLWIHKRSFIIDGSETEAITVPYVNFPFIKHALLYLGLRHRIRTQIHKDNKEELAIISYNADVPIIQVGLWAERHGVRYYPVLSDLPFYDEIKGKRNLSSILSSLGYRSQIKNLRRLKHAIVLNQNTADDFSITDSLLVEGAISQKEATISICNEELPLEKNVLYCGILNSFHGTDTLLEVASLLPDVSFMICGRGDESEERVKEAEKQYSNIHFYGAVSDDELVELQRKTRLLIIPHPVRLKQLRYQFPSKLMTCLSTGIPVLVTPIPGITEEYKEYVIMTQDDSAQSIADSIKDFFANDTQNIGQRGREFVTKYKTWDKQTRRIVNFIKGWKK